MVLFANYKTYVVNVDGQGTTKGKNKAQGGTRVMYSTHHPCWDAKNRHDFPAEMPFEFASIAHIINQTPGAAVKGEEKAVSASPDQCRPVPEPDPFKIPPPIAADTSEIPKNLLDLMQANHVSVEDIQAIVTAKGYYPANTPIKNYDPEFINGVLVGAWPQVYDAILENTQIPFTV
jgi:hypothetical protein